MFQSTSKSQVDLRLIRKSKQTTFNHEKITSYIDLEFPLTSQSKLKFCFFYVVS